MKEVAIPKSYQIQNGKWVPRVYVRKYSPNKIEEQEFTWDKQFDSKKEADAFVEQKTKEVNELKPID